MSKIDVILGGQWGDEGKGKMIDIISSDYEYVARCQGGSNAGYTVIIKDKTYVFHLLPSCLINPDCKAIIGNGVVIHLPTLFKEIEMLKKDGIDVTNRLFISDRAHIVCDMHQELDDMIEELKSKDSLGTTKEGVGPCYSAKMVRNGVRVSDLVNSPVEEFIHKYTALAKFNIHLFSNLIIDIHARTQEFLQYKEKLAPFLVDTVMLANDILRQGKKILAEGANGCMLDIDFGTYPYVTSSNCGSAGICTGLGVPPTRIGKVTAVIKAYTTRVGEGPFPSELSDETGKLLRDTGDEYSTRTKRARRCGWLDLAAIKYAIMVNGITNLTLTKLDVLSALKEIKVVTHYSTSARGVVKEIGSFPANLNEITSGSFMVTEKVFEGWSCDISGCRTYESLPEKCKSYITFVQDFLGVPIDYIGVGPNRDQFIKK